MYYINNFNIHVQTIPQNKKPCEVSPAATARKHHGSLQPTARLLDRESPVDTRSKALGTAPPFAPHFLEATPSDFAPWIFLLEK